MLSLLATGSLSFEEETDESKMMTAEHTALVARNQASDAKLEADKTDAENFGVPDENGEIKSPQTRLIESDYAIEKATAAYEKARDEKRISQKLSFSICWREMKESF